MKMKKTICTLLAIVSMVAIAAPSFGMSMSDLYEDYKLYYKSDDGRIRVYIGKGKDPRYTHYIYVTNKTNKDIYVHYKAEFYGKAVYNSPREKLTFDDRICVPSGTELGQYELLPNSVQVYGLEDYFKFRCYVDEE